MEGIRGYSIESDVSTEEYVYKRSKSCPLCAVPVAPCPVSHETSHDDSILDEAVTSEVAEPVKWHGGEEDSVPANGAPGGAVW